jgi:hypothetical protein
MYAPKQSSPLARTKPDHRPAARLDPPFRAPRPFNLHHVPMSPLRALCLQKSYDQHKSRPLHMPWLCLTEVGLTTGHEVVESNVLGFIPGQKLQSHKLRVIPLQDEDVFPECVDIDRAINDESMYPQHGDLKSTMFKRCRLVGAGVLRKQRIELVRTGGYNGIKVLEVEEVKTVSLKNIEIQASVNEVLADRMKQQLREIEKRRKAVKEAKRGEKQKLV